ncbi:helix-turn-helix domain-containing protein [Flavisphingomonas formosensis]|uniref:helix-turn-helix domain-containing protein n=1 Tax=Flavisphingomonas formosensis TaxID=861534 RepID=UPI0012F73DEB|nr:AraC family transcriptional regulator [Sphingomonas formosensis]
MLETTARLETSTCTIEVIQGEQPKPVEIVWSDARPMASMLFRAADYKAEGRYSGYSASKFGPIGSVLVTVPDQEMIGRGTGGKIRAARCIFHEDYEEVIGSLRGLGLVELTRALDVDNANIHLLLRRMMQEALNPGFAGQALIESMGTTLLIECARAIRRDDQPEKKSGLDPRHLRRIEDYLDSLNVGFPTVAEIARLCGFSSHYFCRMFRQHTGQSVGRYLANWRLQRAEQLLIETDLPLKVIAYKLGFANAANFSTAFRAQWQQPPGSFRSERRLARDGAHTRVAPLLN